MIWTGSSGTSSSYPSCRAVNSQLVLTFVEERRLIWSGGSEEYLEMLVSHLCGGFRSVLGPEASPLRLLCSLLTLNQIRLFHVSDQISLLTVCWEHIEEF